MQRILAYVANGLTWLTGFQSSLPSQHSMIQPVSNSLSYPRVIPGGSNLEFCPESRKTDLFQISRWEVDPTPPLVEEDIDIWIYGSYLKNITDDAVWNWHVRDNSTDGPGEGGTVPFCDVMETIEQPNRHREKECPPEKGFAIMSLHAYVPWFIGEGNLTVRFDAKTKEGERIYCVQGDFELKYPEGKH